MAEAIVSAVVSQLLDLLSKQASQEIDLLTGVEERVMDLSKTYRMIQAVLADAERRKIREGTVKVWLQEIEDVSYVIDDVLDEWNYRILKQQIEGIGQPRVGSLIPSSCFCFKRVFMHRDIAVKIKKLSGELDSIEKRKNQFGFMISSSGVSCNPQDQKRIQSTSFVNVSEVRGRVSDKNALISQLLSMGRQDEKFVPQILAITGAGGIGKTTLAQLAYNDNLVKGHFEQRAWVCVSDPFDEVSVAKTIVESLKPSSSNMAALNLLLEEIKDSIFEKRFLLVLDDVWTEDPAKWELLKSVFQYGDFGSTILLTTRSERVARLAGATNIIHLNLLSDIESWSLFCQVAFLGRSKTDCERLENVGRQITRKCKGLPLAIKILGSLLRIKDTIQEWQMVMESNLWEMQEVEVDLFPHLYLSYNDLSPQMQRCFSYCAIFPKDEKIIVDNLIHIWMAQGYLNSSGNEDEMELKGMEYFENLAMRSFFQDFHRSTEYSEKIYSCKMHDIVHDFAQYLTKRDNLVIRGERKVTSCEIPRHVTWLGGEETNDTPGCHLGQPRSFFSMGLKLETLNAHLLDSLKFVRVIMLKGCGLKMLPREIGNLVHLRYLSLSNNQLKELPETIYDLYNLQTLKIRKCPQLEELPPGIQQLKKLRHLFVNYPHLKYPVGIGKLKCLQTLHEFSLGRASELGYLKNLSQLRSLRINMWANLDDVTVAENADLKSKELLQNLSLSLGSSITVKEDAMEALRPPPNLQRLKVHGFHGTQVPTWMTSLNNLKHLRLDSFQGLMSLPTLGILPSLEMLKIWKFTRLKSVGPAFLGIRESLPSPKIGFPNLLELELFSCQAWEEWEDISAEEETNDIVQIMPCLRRLRIDKCPMLKALPDRVLRKASSLEYIQHNRKIRIRQTAKAKALKRPQLLLKVSHGEVKARSADGPSR